MKSICLFIVIYLSFSCFSWANGNLPIVKGIGGDFSINSSLNKVVHLKDFREKIVLLYFGYTNCPDLCPLTTSHLVALMKRLKEHSHKLQVLFLTIDPDNDTAEVLKKYLDYFDDRFIGLTGTRSQIDHILQLFQAEYELTVDTPMPLEPKVTQRTGVKMGYIYSHSGSVYLIDQKGRLRTLFYLGTPLKKMRDEILALLEE